MITLLDAATKNAQLSALASSLGAGGTIECQNSGGTVLSVMTGVTFGTPSAGSVAVTATADGVNDASGTASKLVFKTSGGTAKFEVPTADIAFGPSTTVTSGGTTTLTSMTITA